jgi:hypothetical protein
MQQCNSQYKVDQFFVPLLCSIQGAVQTLNRGWIQTKLPLGIGYQQENQESGMYAGGSG